MCLLALAGSVWLFSLSRFAHDLPRNPGVHSKLLNPHARSAALRELPMTFEPSAGRGDLGTQFIGRGRGLDVLLREDGFAIAVPGWREAMEGAASNLVEIGLSAARESDGAEKKTSRVKSRHSGAAGRKTARNKKPRKRRRSSRRKTNSRKTTARGLFAWQGRGKVGGESNYLVGRDRSQWRTHVPHYSEADAENVLPGVAMRVYGSAEGVEYDLRVYPRADASKLRLEIDGAADRRIDADGDLILGADAASEVRMKKPTVYEELPGRKNLRQQVAGGYALEVDGSIGFAVGPHDADATLVIDPSLYVTYATFLGGTGTETAASVALDSSGNVYVGGTTTLPNTFPEPATASVGPGINPNGPGTSTGTNTEYFIAKIDPTVSGVNSLVYLTFIGGTVSQSGGLIAVDSSGNVDITGTTTSPDFPVTDGSTLTTGANDVTVSQIDPTGSVLLYSTLFGGSGTESQYAAGGIAVDSSGNIYVASDTSSQNLPVTSGVFQPTFAAQTADGFLAEFQPSSSPALIYCSYLGTNAHIQMGVGGVAIDASNNVYIAGFSSNLENPFPVKNAFQTTYGGDPTDAFVMEVMPAGQGPSDLIYATLLGGGGLDEALAVAVTAFNSVYVAGRTSSWNFPWHDNLQPFNGASDAFLAKFDPSMAGATSLIYATPLGGTAPPGLTVSATATAVAADDFGDVYLAGQTTASDFPTAVSTSGLTNGFQPICSSCQLTPALTDSFLVAVQESSTPQPSVYFNVGSVPFPPQPLGTQNAPQPVAVRNGGEAPLTISSLQITGPNSQDFSLIGPGACSGQTIPSGGECSFEVGFVPSTTAPEGAIVSLTDNAPGSPQALELNGAGEGAFASLSTTTVNFGSQPDGTTRQSAITITNTGNQALTVQSPVESGSGIAQFILNGKEITCGPTLAPNASCSIGVEFSPTAIGTFQAQITITDNSGGVANATQIVTLTGTGTPVAPVANVSPTALTFGDIIVGASSGVQFTPVLNNGSAALNITSILIGGANAADFAMAAAGTNPCATAASTLAIGASCTIGVRFAPAAADSPGTKSAVVVITDNAGGSPQTVALSGNATVPPTAQVSPASLSFAPQSVGTPSAPQIVTVQNTSGSSLSISGISLSGANPADFAETDNCPPSLVHSIGRCNTI